MTKLRKAILEVDQALAQIQKEKDLAAHIRLTRRGYLRIPYREKKRRWRCAKHTYPGARERGFRGTFQEWEWLIALPRPALTR